MLGAALSGACSADESPSVGQLVFEGPIADEPVDEPLDEPDEAPEEPNRDRELAERAAPAMPELGFAVNAAGGISMFRLSDALIVDEHPPPEEGRVQSLAFEHQVNQLSVFVSDEEGQAGHVYRIPIGSAPASLETPQHWAWIDGRVRLSSIAEGLLLFEEGYGERWRVLRHDRKPSASRPSPRPVSAWQARRGGVTWIHALSAESPPRWLRASTANGRLSPPRATSLGPLSPALGARMVPATTWGKVVIASLDANLLKIACYDDAGTRLRAWQTRLVGAGLEEVRALAPSQQVGGERLALLLSEPPSLLVADLRTSGITLSSLALDGQVRHDARFFGREMLKLSEHRLLVATDRGSHAIEVVEGPEGPRLARDPAFKGGPLRGPLARTLPL